MESVFSYVGRVAEYSWAVWPHWHALVVGVVLGAPSMIVSFLPKKTKRKIERRWSERSRNIWLLVAAAVAIFFAGFRAFDDVAVRNQVLQGQIATVTAERDTLRKQAVSTRDRATIKRKLQEFYLEAEPLWKGGGITKASSAEDYDKYRQRISDWRQKTRRWIDQSIGKAAGSFFENYATHMSGLQASYGGAINAEHNWHMTYVGYLRANLAKLIDSDSWDRP